MILNPWPDYRVTAQLWQTTVLAPAKFASYDSAIKKINAVRSLFRNFSYSHAFPAVILAFLVPGSPATASAEAEADPDALPAEETGEETVLEGLEAMRVAIGMARSALEQNDLDRSLQILLALMAVPEFGDLADEERIAAQFHLGQTYAALGQQREAARVYRRILAEFPELVRVRLELGRSLFELREFLLADYHFRLVLAGDLPEVVEANVRQFLARIRRERRWSFDLRASFVQNTNINFAPTARQIEFAGLPEPILLEDAESGIGFSTQFFGEYRHPLADNIRLRLGGQVEHTHYSDSRYHQSVLAGYLGPQFLFDNGAFGSTSASVLFQSYRRWLSFGKFSTGVGPAVEFTFEPADRVRVSARVDHSEVRYQNRDDIDGSYTSATIRPGMVLTPTTFAGLVIGVAHERTDSLVHRNWQYQLGANFIKDLPHGFTVGVHPDYRLLRYEREWAAFGEDRRDHIWQVRTEVFNRRVEWMGFTPVLGYRYQHRSSSIDVFDFDQHRVEGAVRKTF